MQILKNICFRFQNGVKEIFYEKKKETIPELWKYDIVKCKVF